MPGLEPPAPGPPRAGRRTVVLDPGHGGAEPGAIGADGGFEKTITLAMAWKLRDLLEADGRYRVVLTREDDTHVPDPVITRPDENPESDAMLADSVGLALLVVLETLEPAERLAFVLHDVFGMTFDEIGPIVAVQVRHRPAQGPA